MLPFQAENQPSTSPEHKFLWPLIGVLIIVSIASSVFWWLQIKQTKKAEIVQQQVSIDPIADWKTYNNKELGLSFKYPSTWEVISIDPERDPTGINGIYIKDPTDEYPGQGIAVVLERDTSIAQIITTLSIGSMVQQYTTLSRGFEWSVLIYKNANTQLPILLALSQHGSNVVRLGSLYSDLNLSIITKVISSVK